MCYNESTFLVRLLVCYNESTFLVRLLVCYNESTFLVRLWCHLYVTSWLQVPLESWSSTATVDAHVTFWECVHVQWPCAQGSVRGWERGYKYKCS